MVPDGTSLGWCPEVARDELLLLPRETHLETFNAWRSVSFSHEYPVYSIPIRAVVATPKVLVPGFRRG